MQGFFILESNRLKIQVGANMKLVKSVELDDIESVDFLEVVTPFIFSPFLFFKLGFII